MHRRTPRIIDTSLALLLAVTATAAAAHDILVFPDWKDGQLAADIRYGHPADYQPIVPDKLFAFEAIAPGGAAQDWRSTLKLDAMDLKMMQAPGWKPDAGIALLTAQYDNGYWSKNAAGVTVNTSRVNNPKTAMASHNMKYGKAIVATSPTHSGFDRIVGHKLELIPKRDPLAMKVGDVLPVEVRFNGKPLVGAGVEIGDSVTAVPEDKIARYRTDAKGVAMVPIGKAGWEVLGVDHEEKSPTPRLADHEKYTATLVFRLP